MTRVFFLIAVLFLSACQGEPGTELMELEYDGVYVAKLPLDAESYNAETNNIQYVRFYPNGDVSSLIVSEELRGRDDTYVFNLVFLMQDDILQKGRYERSGNKIHFKLSIPERFQDESFNGEIDIFEHTGQILPSKLNLKFHNQKTGYKAQADYKFHKVFGLHNPSILETR